ncbi:MAG: hypothetical protein P1P88_04935 [Bacteroidales bacterium]|nr:hypothetical protein [Bacteroidales bacterium]
MPKQTGGQEMRDLAAMINKQIPGLGFALFVFPLNEPGMANYVSNGQREDMIKMLRETLARFENGGIVQTPERN